MSNFINYLVESGISLSLFALVYFLFLRRETFFSINRWFLLISVGFSALLPLLHIPFYTTKSLMLPEVTITPYANLLSMVTVYGTELSNITEHLVLNYTVIGYIYLLGMVYFAGMLLFQILQIYRLIVQNRVVSDGKIKLVFLDRELSPFSFLNYVFVSENLQNTKGWEKMLEHEKQHIKQGHTFDVLVLELVAVFQWFNPFFWLFRRALRENHEFLADQAVISQGTAPSWYKQILINQYVGDQIVLTNNFNYSLVKNRIQMISKIKSKKVAIVKVLFGILMAVCLTAVFAFEPEAQTKPGKDQVKSDQIQDKVYENVEQMPEYPGGMEEMGKYIGSSIKYPVEAMKNKIQGKVFISFVIARDGLVTDAKIARGVDPMLDAEALRVINSMPKWIPGKDKGKIVAVQLTVPINFALR
ncbi:MAG: M56 family metallopeptidase [Bacteroidia bacterium]